LDGSSRVISLEIGMNAHSAEIRPETRLEKTARGRIERLPGRMRRCIDGWRSGLSQFARANTFA